MEWFRRVRDTLWEHKRLVGGALLVAGGVVLYRRLRPMWDEVQSMLKMMEQLEKSGKEDETARQNGLETRFASHMRVANTTIVELAVEKSRQRLEEIFDIAGQRQRLKTGAKHNLEAWTKFMVDGLARTIAAAYVTSVLDSLMKLQLSIISRHVLLDERPSSEANRCFMGVFTYAQESGLVALADRVRLAVAAVASGWDLQARCTYAELAALLADVRTAVEGDLGLLIAPDAEEGAGGLLELIFPPAGALEVPGPDQRAADAAALPPWMPPPGGGQRELSSSAQLDEMVAELRLLLGTPSFSRALSGLLGEVFAACLEHLETVFRVGAPSANPVGSGLGGGPDSGPDLEAPVAPAVVPFATVMMGVTKLFKQMLPEDVADANSSFLFVTQRDSKHVEALCRVIYFPVMNQQPAAGGGLGEGAGGGDAALGSSRGGGGAVGAPGGGSAASDHPVAQAVMIEPPRSLQGGLSGLPVFDTH